ncbi:hypothetical protein D3C75_1046640 [compost metagenome]
MRYDRHEVVAHAYRMLQLTARHLQLRQQQLLLLAAALKGLQLPVEHFALAVKVDKHRDLVFHRQGI